MSDYVSVNINGEPKAAMLVAAASINAASTTNEAAAWSYVADEDGIENSTAGVTIKAAAGAGISNFISWFEFSTDGALGTATELVIRDGAGGTILWRSKLGTDGLPSGRVINFDGGIKSSPGTLLEVATLTATGTGAVFVNAGGYEG